ncbi:oxidoreductase [Mycolicibacterium anyangense]|uniref:Oxidoreductase n=1 Tax=Mycolicibacterium anyangense TaxID=1431246 RepID=A0A6N4W493_9MYCO|nr:SDR family oxidoreductase [Mycolicibacterium anyangense]BBZ74927.1 oxidoreductase [Mycolicibacterium anyangense]
MTRVSVITGAAGGMGLATAGIIGRDHTVVLCDVRGDRLDHAVTSLREAGVRATAVRCDVTDRRAVTGLFETAAALGPIASVVHAAGVSPSMGGADYIVTTNALGTLQVNEMFFGAAAPGAAIVNVASMASHMLPDEIVPIEHFNLAFTDADRFLAEMLAACDLAGEAMRSGLAYSLSKYFVRWYSCAQAERFNSRGLRIVSVSPGSVDTEMGLLEENNGAGAMVADFAVPRWGSAQEMAELFAFCVSDRAGYLTGTDILNDGGVIASMRERVRRAAQKA